MIDKDKKRKQSQEFTAAHTLTKEQLKKLIYDKLERGKQYSIANRKRESSTGTR